MANKKENKFLKGGAPENGYFGLGRAIDFYDPITRVALIIAVLVSVAGTVWKTMVGVSSEESVYLEFMLQPHFSLHGS